MQLGQRLGVSGIFGVSGAQQLRLEVVSFEFILNWLPSGYDSQFAMERSTILNR